MGDIDSGADEAPPLRSRPARRRRPWEARAGCADEACSSRNTLVFDFLTLGELFQNNHHKYAMRPNFAVRRFELDPTYQVMRLFAWLGIIDMKPLRELSPEEQGELRPAG
jgi:stearoyl-CoA desaturase (Delta-9 desaturase)